MRARVPHPVISSYCAMNHANVSVERLLRRVAYARLHDVPLQLPSEGRVIVTMPTVGFRLFAKHGRRA